MATKAQAVHRDQVVITGLAAIKAQAVPRDRVAITGLAAIKAQAVHRDQVVITGLAAIMDRAAIMGLGVIMGTVDTTGMEIRIAHVSGSAQDGDQGGGAPRPTRIIHTTRTIQRRQL